MATQSLVKDSFYKERLLHTTTFPNYSESHEDEEDKLKTLNEEDIKSGLHNFGKTSSGENYAFLNFKLNYQTIETISKLSHYIYLQAIDVSNNNIKSLRPLSTLRYLTTLNASYNSLKDLLDFKQLPYSLDEVNISHNLIQKITDLSKHRYLRILNLRNNKISKIQGLKGSRNLKILDLSENQIEDIQGLDGLNLTELYLASNRIEVIKGFSRLQKLRVLDLSINKISKLSELVHLVSLRTLILNKNLIKNVRETQFLENLIYLSQLSYCFNPIQERRYYRFQILYKLPMLKSLDGVEVTETEIVKAENLYGVDVQQRLNIFKGILPEEEFIDRRIHVADLIQPESDDGGQQIKFMDKYDEQGKLKSDPSRSHKSKDRSNSASKRSVFSKNSKISKKSAI